DDHIADFRRSTLPAAAAPRRSSRHHTFSAPGTGFFAAETAAGLQAAVTCHGHSGQADCTPIAVAESLCRETDRYDPTGMSRPHDRIWGGAPAPDSGPVCRVL